MKSRGLTMIETLMALALLAGLIAGGAVWLSTSVRASELVTALRSESAIESVLTRIQEDLLVGDFESRDARPEWPPRVRVVDNSLAIDTRKDVTHLYRLIRDTDAQQALVRQVRDQGSISVRRLLTDIHAFSCVIDDDKRWLDVTITSRASRSVTSGPEGEQSVHRRLRLR